MDFMSSIILLSYLMSSGTLTGKTRSSELLEEQSFFSGSYVQTHSYDDGQNIDLGGQNTGDIISFDLNSRSHASFGPCLSESDIDANDFYSPVFDGYEFKRYRDGKYDQFILDEETMDGVAWGPKESPSNSTCKIRVYYHDISHNGSLVTLMYDFTGFLVGDSLLMTAAHGLYRDVTVGDYDDGIDNKYIPGKVEVYGAIGMADTWGPSYTYYAKGTKVFFPSSYATYRSFADDWALLRLDTPLGRELSYRKLSLAQMDLSEDYRIIGYPSFNQFHIRMDVSAANYVVDSTRPMIEYNVSSQDGMSGSPFYSSHDETTSTEVGSDGHSYLATRSTFGMHVCTNVERTTSYAITFDSQIIDLVDTLNSKYEKSFDAIQFSELDYSGQLLGETSVSVGGGYECKIHTEGASLIGGRLAMRPGSSVSLEFPFPLSSASLFTGRLDYQPDMSVFCGSFDENSDFEDVISPCGGEYSVSAYGLRSINIIYSGPLNGRTTYLDYISFYIDWGFSPSNNSAPQYVQMSDFDGNCVSYAMDGIERLNTGSILPKRSDESVLNRLTDYYPGMLVLGLAKALESEGIRMEPIGKYAVCSPGSYKIAILCDPYRYYHVIRQNDRGAWSHYIIGEGVQCWDSDYNYIAWPDEARMAHAWGSGSGGETHFDLTSFVGYFSVRSVENE